MLQVKAALEDQYAGKAANDMVGALTALLKDSPRVNPRKGAPLEAFSNVPQARASCPCLQAYFAIKPLPLCTNNLHNCTHETRLTGTLSSAINLVDSIKYMDSCCSLTFSKRAVYASLLLAPLCHLLRLQ